MMEDGLREPERVMERIWTRSTLDENGCWVWSGSLDDGYGTLSIDGRSYRAHRASLLAHRGPFRKVLVVDHLCRNRACVNPDHLEAVMPQVNTARGLNPLRKGIPTGCRKHGTSDGHLYHYADDRVLWVCHACGRK